MNFLGCEFGAVQGGLSAVSAAALCTAEVVCAGIGMDYMSIIDADVGASIQQLR
jgi:hypothetical protein